jgi:hypothetical protein
MEFKTLDPVERDKLYKALRGNAEDGQVLRMGPDTTFVGSDGAELMPTDDEVISAIKSVPVHYAENLHVDEDPDDHKRRHELLHSMMDELVADWFRHTDSVTSSPVADLMKWSHGQTIEPTPTASARPRRLNSAKTQTRPPA